MFRVKKRYYFVKIKHKMNLYMLKLKNKVFSSPNKTKSASIHKYISRMQKFAILVIHTQQKFFCTLRQLSYLHYLL